MNQEKNKEIYRIRVKGRLDQSWSSWFDDMALTFEKGETLITGAVADQSALHGLLTKVRDVGLTLIDVQRIEPENKQG